MKNLFSSPRFRLDFQKFVIKQLDALLNEQRLQRADLAQLLRMTGKLQSNKDLQKQVDDFYKTSPQTDTVTNLDSDYGN